MWCLSRYALISATVLAEVGTESSVDDASVALTAGLFVDGVAGVGDSELLEAPELPEPVELELPVLGVEALPSFDPPVAGAVVSPPWLGEGFEPPPLLLPDGEVILMDYLNLKQLHQQF